MMPLIIGLGTMMEQLSFSVFGSVELFGLAIIIAVALIMGASRIPPKFMLMASSFIVIIFKVIYGGTVFNILTVIIVLIYGFMIARTIINMFSN